MVELIFFHKFVIKYNFCYTVATHTAICSVLHEMRYFRSNTLFAQLYSEKWPETSDIEILFRIAAIGRTRNSATERIR